MKKYVSSMKFHTIYSRFLIVIWFEQLK